MGHEHIRPTRTGALGITVPTGMAKMEIQTKGRSLRSIQHPNQRPMAYLFRVAGQGARDLNASRWLTTTGRRSKWHAPQSIQASTWLRNSALSTWVPPDWRVSCRRRLTQNRTHNRHFVNFREAANIAYRPHNKSSVNFRPLLMLLSSQGFFSLAMVARLEALLRERGEWFYRRLFWECGLIGQVLYLEAEVTCLAFFGSAEA